MRLSVFAVGLSLVFLGITFMFSSNLSHQRESISTWELVKTEVDALQISSNFTEGDIVEVVVSPNANWTKIPLEPTPPPPSKYVWVNITDPHGNKSWYEIRYVEAEGTLTIYNVTLESPNGFGSQESLQKEKGVVGKALYSGEYVAEVWFVGPGGGPGPPSSLAFMKANVTFTTEYPYASYFYPAVAMFLIGVVLSIWGAKTSKRQVSVKRRTRVKRR